MILIDSNVPMYLIGAAHPNKVAAQRVLERLVANRVRLVTDAEVFQEILHRYVAIDRRSAIQPAFDALLAVVDELMCLAFGKILAIGEPREVMASPEVIEVYLGSTFDMGESA